MRYAFASTLLVSGAVAAPHVRRQAGLWQPEIGAKWQIVISQPVDATTTIVPTDATVLDVDLFYTTASDIASMKEQGKSVICYFSAGSAENWRSDYASFPRAAIGSGLQGWAGENWLDIRNEGVLDVMKERIDLAREKGCDAIDPDNMDAYSNGGGGFGLSQQDSLAYLESIAEYAAAEGISTGLKNAQEILTGAIPSIQFAVNEECMYVEETGCSEYQPLLAANKPVFHIEYDDEGSNGSNRAKHGVSAKTRKGRPGVGKKAVPITNLSQLCGEGGLGGQLSTVIKHLSLDGYVQYCDGSTADTAINEDYSTGDPKQGGDQEAYKASWHGPLPKTAPPATAPIKPNPPKLPWTPKSPGRL